ncbi:MAG: hypothetical protein AAF403_07850 [Pseudomonadota bacterium]
MFRISRRHVADLVASTGCNVGQNVTKKLHYWLLVIKILEGWRQVKQEVKKHLKAQDLILKGHDIRILQESDFMDMISER